MPVKKTDIIAQLQQEILMLQGFRPVQAAVTDVGLGSILNAFPNATFPTGALHELISHTADQIAATTGFIVGLLGYLMQQGGACMWISQHKYVFPPALKAFGITPDRIIFIHLQKDRDICWAMEEALKCPGLAAVVGDIKELTFATSRRLQLAVEQSQVTGFIFRHQPGTLNATTCVARWQITSMASALEEDLPGVGYPRWEVTLLKVRNGKPGSWILEWSQGRFRQITTTTTVSPAIPLRNIG